jgi:hypothetical protein
MVVEEGTAAAAFALPHPSCMPGFFCKYRRYDAVFPSTTGPLYPKSAENGRTGLAFLSFFLHIIAKIVRNRLKLGRENGIIPAY